MILKPEALYFCDNGMVLCGKHCGNCAQSTGRDTSGQKVLRVPASDTMFTCEVCDSRGAAA